MTPKTPIKLFRHEHGTSPPEAWMLGVSDSVWTRLFQELERPLWRSIKHGLRFAVEKEIDAG